MPPRTEPLYGALDIATQTGAAIGAPNTVPALTSWKVSGSAGAKALLFMQRAAAWIDAQPLDEIFIEEPMTPHVAVSIGTTAETAMLLNGLVLIVLALGASRKVPVTMFPRQEALEHFTGRRRYPEKNGAKIACEVRCRQLRWPADNWDESDAAAIWDYGWSLRHSRLALATRAARPRDFRK